MTYLFKKKLFIIAEIGSNHCGKKKLAFKAIDEAKKSGADAIKFQTIDFKEIYKKPREYERKYPNISSSGWAAITKILLFLIINFFLFF